MESNINEQVDALLQDLGVTEVLKAIQARLKFDADNNLFGDPEVNEMVSQTSTLVGVAAASSEEIF